MPSVMLALREYPICRESENQNARAKTILCQLESHMSANWLQIPLQCRIQRHLYLLENHKIHFFQKCRFLKIPKILYYADLYYQIGCGQISTTNKSKLIKDINRLYYQTLINAAVLRLGPSVGSNVAKLSIIQNVSLNQNQLCGNTVYTVSYSLKIYRTLLPVQGKAEKASMKKMYLRENRIFFSSHVIGIYRYM